MFGGLIGLFGHSGLCGGLVFSESAGDSWICLGGGRRNGCIKGGEGVEVLKGPEDFAGSI